MPTVSFDNLNFYDLSSKDGIDLVSEKVEASKNATGESELLFNSVLDALIEYGHFNVSDQLYYRMRSGFGDRHVKRVTDDLSAWRKYGYIVFPLLTPDLKPSPDESSARNPGYWSNFANCSFWVLLKFCGHVHHYSKDEFLEEAKAFYSFIKNNYDIFKVKKHTHDFVTLSESFGKAPNYYEQSIETKATNFLTVQELLPEMSLFLQKVEAENIEKWVDLIISHSSEALTDKSWLVQYPSDNLWHQIPYEAFNPCYLGRAELVQPIIDDSCENTVVHNDYYGTGIAWKTTAGSSKIPLSSDSPELYYLDGYGENLYYFFEYFIRVCRFEKAIFDVTGLKIGLFNQDFVLNKPSPDGRSHVDAPTDRLEYFNPEIQKPMMSSGERSILAIAASCFFSSGYIEEDPTYGSPTASQFHWNGYLLPKRYRCVLLDEPENSLHISWQENLLGALDEMIQGQNVQVIVATHAPGIISDKEDWLMEVLE